MSEMSNGNQETIADIVAWIRRHASVYGYDLADRIESAAKREREAGAEAAQICGEIGEMVGREATREKYSQVGNAAAMREALEALLGVIYKCDSGDQLWWHIGAKGVKPLKDARAALSAPPRNCDIMDWRTAWAKWRTECHPQKPCGYAEALSGTEQFMDWYMSEAKGETK